MKAAKITSILQKKIKKTAKLCKVIAPDFNSDTIHDFRVEVKKLRSFLRLIDSNKNEPQIKIPAKFRRIYHIAGSIREAQLEQKFLSDNNIQLPSYHNHLSNNIARLTKEWDKHYSKNVIDKLEDKILNHNIKDLSPAGLQKFAANHWDTAVKLSRKKVISNDQVHFIRKQVKDIMYNIKLAEDKWKKGYSKLQNFVDIDMDKLTDTIGNYNDERVRLEHLSAFMPSITSDGEKEIITQLNNEASKRLQTAKKKIIALFQ